MDSPSGGSDNKGSIWLDLLQTSRSHLLLSDLQITEAIRMELVARRERRLVKHMSKLYENLLNSN